MLLTSASGEEAQTLNYVWRPSGEVPIYPAYHNSLPSFHIFGGLLSTEPEQPIAQPYTPTPDETVPIPRAGENFDAGTVPQPPPYSWTQTSDPITVASNNHSRIGDQSHVHSQPLHLQQTSGDESFTHTLVSVHREVFLGRDSTIHKPADLGEDWREAFRAPHFTSRQAT